MRCSAPCMRQRLRRCRMWLLSRTRVTVRTDRDHRAVLTDEKISATELRARAEQAFSGGSLRAGRGRCLPRPRGAPGGARPARRHTGGHGSRGSSRPRRRVPTPAASGRCQRRALRRCAVRRPAGYARPGCRRSRARRRAGDGAMTTALTPRRTRPLSPGRTAGGADTASAWCWWWPSSRRWASPSGRVAARGRQHRWTLTTLAQPEPRRSSRCWGTRGSTWRSPAPSPTSRTSTRATT